MIRYIFSGFIILHGIIHLMGFARAFKYAKATAWTREISKLSGLLWLGTAVLFILAAAFVLLRKERWAPLAIIAVILSQALIISWWKEAKFGSVPNIIILVAAIFALANYSFINLVKREVFSLLSQPKPPATTVTTQMFAGMPGIVQKWLSTSGIVGKDSSQFVRLKQKGQMRTKAKGNWMPFTATQYFTVDEPQFVWKAKVKMMPFVTMYGRDKLTKGKAEMTIKLAALVNLVNARANYKLNSATMIRYLAEISWFPAAALSNYIKWESIDATSVKATMSYSGIIVSGIMHFKESGDLVCFEAERYMGDGKNASLEKWCVEVDDYKTFHGIRIPYKNKVTWKLKSGDFTWATIEVTDIEYNNRTMYKT